MATMGGQVQASMGNSSIRMEGTFWQFHLPEFLDLVSHCNQEVKNICLIIRCHGSWLVVMALGECDYVVYDCVLLTTCCEISQSERTNQMKCRLPGASRFSGSS